MSESTESTPETLEELACRWWEIEAPRHAGGNTTEDALVHMEKCACNILAILVKELPDSCSAQEARTWARSREAFDEVMATFPPASDEARDCFLFLIQAIALLYYADRCRHEIEAGSADSAAVAMYYTLRACDSIDQDKERPLREQYERLRAASEHTRKKNVESAHREHLIWRGELFRLTNLHPDWQRKDIIKKIATDAGRTPKHVQRMLKRMEQNEAPDS